jgi:hypothetical protein
LKSNVADSDDLEKFARSLFDTELSVNIGEMPEQQTQDTTIVSEPVSQYADYDPVQFPYLVAIDSVRNNEVCIVQISSLKKSIIKLDFDREVNY